MEFNFPNVKGTGMGNLIPHISHDAQDLISKLLIYNPDNRINASQALKHPWFKELRE
jgi:renal tumor antigen